MVNFSPENVEKDLLWTLGHFWSILAENWFKRTFLLPRSGKFLGPFWSHFSEKLVQKDLSWYPRALLVNFWRKFAQKDLFWSNLVEVLPKRRFLLESRMSPPPPVGATQRLPKASSSTSNSSMAHLPSQKSTIPCTFSTFFAFG